VRFSQRLRQLRADLARNRTTARRYGMAVVVTALALLVALTVQSVTHLRTNLLLVTPVAISAWYGGRGPGIFASALSIAAIILTFDPTSPAALDVPGIGKVVYVSTFVVVALIIGTATESLRTERARAIERARQLEQVQETTAELARVQTASEVGSVVLGRGLDAIGATRGFLARVDGPAVEVLSARGYPPEVEARLVGPATDLPLIARAVNTGTPIWLRSLEENRKHQRRLDERLRLAPENAAQLSGFIPLLSGGEIIGALSLSFVDPATDSRVAETFALMLANAAGEALGRARSYDAEHVAREKAETLAAARADVLGVVAHDLRNPLGLVSSSASFLLDEDPAPEQRHEMLEVMQRAVRQMNRLIGDLLDATRLQAGRLRLDVRDVDVRSLLGDAIESSRPSAKERQIELSSEAPAGYRVRADPGRLLQVIGNLSTNAIKFTPVGGRVMLSVKPVAGEMVFAVSDNGPGMTPDEMDHLFDRFWQARDADRRGIGLGLVISKGIVEAHGGRIWAESTPGRGSTFAFSVPAITAPGLAA
jgi:signal transduction histidine kinase